jgi:hypothetical protein
MATVVFRTTPVKPARHTKVVRTDMRPQNCYTLEIHVFCDTSERAYGAVASLQRESQDRETTTSLVSSKSRVTPPKKVVLPRLELMGAVIGARLANNLMTTLKIEEKQIEMWTDSMIVLHWICSSAQ